MKNALLRIARKFGYQKNLMRADVVAPADEGLPGALEVALEELDRIAETRGMATHLSTLRYRGKVEVVVGGKRVAGLPALTADRFEAKAIKENK